MNRADALRINISTWNAKAKRLRHEVTQLDLAIKQLEQDTTPMTLLPLPAADEAMLQGVRLKLVQMAVHNDHEFTCPGEVMDDMLQLIADLREVAANPPDFRAYLIDDGSAAQMVTPQHITQAQAKANQRALQQLREGAR